MCLSRFPQSTYIITLWRKKILLLKQSLERGIEYLWRGWEDFGSLCVIKWDVNGRICCFEKPLWIHKFIITQDNTYFLRCERTQLKKTKHKNKPTHKVLLSSASGSSVASFRFSKLIFSLGLWFHANNTASWNVVTSKSYWPTSFLNVIYNR